MSDEKVIFEQRVVETETGFRIELNGDKEQIRKGLGRFMRFGGPRPHGRGDHKGRKMHRRGRDMAEANHAEHGPYGHRWADHPEMEPPPHVRRQMRRRMMRAKGHGRGRGRHGEERPWGWWWQDVEADVEPEAMQPSAPDAPSQKGASDHGNPAA